MYSSSENILNKKYYFLIFSLVFRIPDDCMWQHDGMFFTTYDNENSGFYCASTYGITERGGIMHVTWQILTGSMGTQIMTKGSIGMTGKVTITQ